MSSLPAIIQTSVSLAPLTSWQVGGEAEFFSQPKDLQELKDAHAWAQKNSLPVTILGGGSNVLISDLGIDGLVISTKYLNQIQFRVEELSNKIDRFDFAHQSSRSCLIIEAETGVGKSDLLKLFLKHKLAPALFLAGLPGDVGGGVVMNAGVAEKFTPREFDEMILGIDVLKPNGELKKYSHQEIQWTYRHSDGWQPGIVYKVYLAWPFIQDLTILDRVKEANKIRLSKQPLDKPSCGSVFKNPEPEASSGLKAAQLIDQCGLKGFRVGDAQVSLKHANFIVNLGSAKASDILQVIQHVQETVLKQMKVSLQTEVQRLGRW